MAEYKLGEVESVFADIIWNNEPLSSRRLAELAEARLNWKRTTTYTILKRLCDRELFQNNNGTVTSRVSREEFTARMLRTGELAADMGTVLYGEEAVELGLIDHIGGLADALDCLHQMIAGRNRNTAPASTDTPPKE